MISTNALAVPSPTVAAAQSSPRVVLARLAAALASSRFDGLAGRLQAEALAPHGLTRSRNAVPMVTPTMM